MVRLIYSAIPLSSQVGGHSGVQISEDGSLIFKPAVPLELHFYQSIASNPALAPLRPFIPKFYGTLKLEGQIDTERSATGAEIAIKPADTAKLGARDFLVLENLTRPFLKPNILDIKLGTVLYDEAASPEKIVRMIATAKATTSFETGIRLTGFQVYDYQSALPVITPKAYGKSIKASDLPEGFAKFFPLFSTTSTHTPSVSSGGLPRRLLLPILHRIRDEIRMMRDAFENVHLRMPGESILIAYEADWQRADEGLKLLDVRNQASQLDGQQKDIAHLEQDIAEEDGGDDDDDDDDNNDDDDDVEDTPSRSGLPYTVNLIDFAHTRLKPGEGPDEGALVGLNTILRLLDNRIEQVESVAAE